MGACALQEYQTKLLKKQCITGIVLRNATFGVRATYLDINDLSTVSHARVNKLGNMLEN